MSPSLTRNAALEKELKDKREKNRIAQRNFREKKRNQVNKMMNILQRVKLAATKHDIGQIQELVRSPSIVLPAEMSSMVVSKQPEPSQSAQRS